MTNTPTLNPSVATTPKTPAGLKPKPATPETETAPATPTANASKAAEPLRGSVIDEVTELPMGRVPLLWTVSLGGPSPRRPGRSVIIGRGLSEADGSFAIAPLDGEEVHEALCQHACMRSVKAWVEVDTQGETTARKVEVVRGAAETLLRVSGNGQELTTDDWREAADFLQSNRLFTAGELVHALTAPGGGSPLAEWRTAKRARALGHIAAVAEQAGQHLPGTALLDFEHQADLDALAEGELDKAVNRFRSLDDFKRFGGVETEWHVGLFPTRKSDMELYRDYLRGTWVAAAKKMYVASGYKGPVADGLLERQIVGRFHQDFRTSDTAAAPAAKLLIPILREALLTPTNRDGFGLTPAAIPAQGAQSDEDYLGVLIGLTGKSVHELRNRYRVRFDRALGEQTDPIALNVEALLGLLADTWQSPEEPFSAEPAIWVPAETGKPLIFTPFIGRAPFYLQFEEWQQQTLRFYPENVYNVRRNIPLFDPAFREAVKGQKANATRWDVAYNAVAYNGSAYYKSAADWTASGAWIESLFPIADTIREAMRIADSQDYPQADGKLNWCADALNKAISAYQTSWIKDKFYWSYSNDVWADKSPLISLKSRSTRSVKNAGELDAFEKWYEWQEILLWKGVPNDMESEIRDMQFTHARSLLIYDALHLYYVLIPYLRASIRMATGDYATASKLLGRITGYEVGIGETASPAGYPEKPEWDKPAMADGTTLPYSTAIGVEAHYYTDLTPTFENYTFKDKIVLAPFELRFFQLAQGEAMLLLADELYRNDDPSSIRRAREMFKGVIFLHGEDPDIDPHFVPQYYGGDPFGKLDAGNPARTAQLARARLGFYQIEQGLNVYGFRSDMVPVLRYRPLKQAADLFAAGAKSAQADFLSYMMKFEQAQIEAWQTNALLKKAEASAVIAGEHIEIAKVGVGKAQEQVAQVKAQITAKQQEIADSNSFFNQFKTFFGGMKDSITGMVPLADKVMNDDSPASSVSGDQLKAILTKSLSSTSAGKEAATAALGSGAAMAIGFGVFAYAGYTSMSSMADTIAKRDGDLKSLQTVALPAAEAQVKLKQRDVTIAQQELAIAKADVELAQALRRFQQDRFLNVDLWNKLATFANQLIRRYLDLAARTGWLAERALAYEQNRDVRIIRMNYYPKAMRGLTGADRLQLDLAELEANRLQGVRLTVPVKHTISLARHYPLEFGQLKDKGRCRIRTRETPLRAAYPGSFGYRIRAVTVAAQDASGAPPRGMFRNLGVSEVARDDTLKPNLLLRFPDALPLSEFRLQDDLFVYGLPGETLLQFEGSGIETAWELDLPAAPNPQGLRSLSDVVITFDMNASYSQALAGKLAAEPPAPVSRAIMLAASVQDSRGLANLRVGTDPARLRFDLRQAALPTQEKNRKLANLALLAIGKTTKTYNATLKAVTAGAQATFQIKDGLALSNAGDLLAGGAASPLNALVGVDLDQVFELEITRAGVQDELRTLFDVVLYLDYKADL